MGKPWLLCVWYLKSLLSSSLWSSLVCLPNLNLWKICSCRRSQSDDLSWWHAFVMHLPSRRLAGGWGFHPSLWHHWEYPCSFCCLSAFFLSFPLTLLCLPTVWLSVCSSPSSFLASIFLFPSHCVLFSSRLPSTLNVCFQKGMHRSEPDAPQFPALFLSTSYVAKAGWFATLFFSCSSCPPHLYNFLHGFIALQKTERLPSDPEDLTSGLLFLSTQGTVFKFYGVWGLILDTRHLLWLRKPLGKIDTEIFK